MRTQSLVSLCVLGALTYLPACGSDPVEEPAAAGGAVSPIAIDAQIRGDLKLALTIGARCQPRDSECRASFSSRIAKRDFSDAVAARVSALVDGLDRADFCEQLTLAESSRVVFAIGAGSVIGDGEGLIAFDLSSFGAVALTSRAGFGALVGGGPYEVLARSESGTLFELGGAGVQAAPPSLVIPETTPWTADGGWAGAVRPAPNGELARATLVSLLNVDGSRFTDQATPSRSSAFVLARTFEPLAKAEGQLLSFRTPPNGVRPGAATAIAVTQVAGLDGLGPRAAALAIAADRVSSLPGGIAAYCGTGKAALTTRSFGGAVRPRDIGIQIDVSLGTSFGGVGNRDGSSNGETDEPLDCSSGFEELSCASAYPNKPNLMCSFAGKGKSCCRAPIEDPDGLQPCTPGPDSGCGADKVCVRAAESGPNATRYVCLGEDSCEAFGGPSQPLPAGQCESPNRNRYFHTFEAWSIMTRSMAESDAITGAANECWEGEKNGETDCYNLCSNRKLYKTSCYLKKRDWLPDYWICSAEITLKKEE